MFTVMFMGKRAFQGMLPLEYDDECSDKRNG